MASFNFFDKKFRQEAARTDSEFGIVDPGQSRPAFTTLDKGLFQARVFNQNGNPVQFVAIDHNMGIKRTNGNDESTCDGMLYVDKRYLAFVELKDEMSGWISDAVGQLGNTINIFAANHYITDFGIRLAFAANKQHPNFAYSHKEMMQQFKNDTKFVLRVQNHIVVRL